MSEDGASPAVVLVRPIARDRRATASPGAIFDLISSLDPSSDEDGEGGDGGAASPTDAAAALAASPLSDQLGASPEAPPAAAAPVVRASATPWRSNLASSNLLASAKGDAAARGDTATAMRRRGGVMFASSPHVVQFTSEAPPLTLMNESAVGGDDMRARLDAATGIGAPGSYNDDDDGASSIESVETSLNSSILKEWDTNVAVLVRVWGGCDYVVLGHVW